MRLVKVSTQETFLANSITVIDVTDDDVAILLACGYYRKDVIEGTETWQKKPCIIDGEKLLETICNRACGCKHEECWLADKCCEIAAPILEMMSAQ